MLSGILSDRYYAILSGIYSDILSYLDLSGVFPGIHSGILPGIYSHILDSIWHSISGNLSGNLTGILSHVLSGTLWHEFWSSLRWRFAVRVQTQSTASWAGDLEFGTASGAGKGDEDERSPRCGCV